MRQFDNTMQHADFPLGGIGTGTISLHASGHLKDFQIFNRPSLDVKVPYSFFGMHAQWGDKTDTRVVEAEQFPDFYKGRGYHPITTMGLKRFKASTMRVRYPFAEIDFEDSSLPFGVHMSAFTPFVPMNADDSGIPAAVFHIDVENRSGCEAQVLLASSMGNIHNYRGSDCFDNVLVSPDCENLAMREADLSGVFMTGHAVPEDDLRYSNNAILTPEPDAELLKMWYRGGWYDGIMDFWSKFSQGIIESQDGDDKFSVVGPESCVVGSVGVRKTIAPGERARFTFVLSWYVPNRIRGWFDGDNGGQTMKNYYATQYGDAFEVGRSLIHRLSGLESASRRFADALYDSSLPDSMLDAVASNIAVLRSNTCFRMEDGTFMGWEGSHEQMGSCHGTCTHVWNYAQTVAFLFPELEKSARRNEFLVETNEDGKMTFRAQRRLGMPDWGMYPAADGQFGTIMRAWREWKLSGDKAYLEEIYSSVVRAFEFGLREWDQDGDGVPEARQHNTYDIEFFGPNPLSAVMELGAIKAMAAMAREMGDGERAGKMEDLFERAQKRFDELCWQGEFYCQRLENVDQYPYQFGEGCLSDQLLGQTMAYLAGLGQLLPEDRLNSAIRAVYRHNFLTGPERKECLQRLYVAQDEPGLVLCSWPNGGTPRFPFVYSGEVWTGIEYQVATLLVYQGMMEEAEHLVSAVRRRFDGVRRSPWNEMECGFYYARAMASWGLLIAMSGFECDAAHGYLKFAPKQKEGRVFWSMGGAWGRARFEGSRFELRLSQGCLKLKTVSIPGIDRIQRLCLNGSERKFDLKADLISIPEGIELKADDALSIELK